MEDPAVFRRTLREIFLVVSFDGSWDKPFDFPVECPDFFEVLGVSVD